MIEKQNRQEYEDSIFMEKQTDKNMKILYLWKSKQTRI
jgi:hypothetical protein